MFGTALRLMGAQQALNRVRVRTEMGLERMSEQVQNLVLRYLVLSIAGIAFLGAGVFGVLAGFWGFRQLIRDNGAASAGVMAGILILVGLLIALVAYGITQAKTTPTRARFMEKYPIRNAQNPLNPAVDDVAVRIERAVHQFGPVRVATAAAAAGLLVGVVAKRLRQI